MKAYGYDRYYGPLSGGTVGLYLSLWTGLAEGIFLLVREVYRVQRRRKADNLRRKTASERARRIAESRPRSLNPPPSPAAVSAQWRKARGLAQNRGKALPTAVLSAEAPISAATPKPGEALPTAVLSAEAPISAATPKPGEATAAKPRQGRRSRGSVSDALRFGSLLLDLEPTVDSSPVVRLNRATTRKVIVARNPGLKGWLHRHCPEVVYTTAMRYKQMAAQSRRACGLPKDVPLEWIFEDEASKDSSRAHRTPADLPAARATLMSMRSGPINKRQYLQKVEDRLGTTHFTLKKPRKHPCPAAKRRMDDRHVETLLRLVHDRTRKRIASLDAAAREKLRLGLLHLTSEVKQDTA